ncbi:MAG: CotH kinase family protein [Reichenbachiella sp.]
MKKLFLLLNIVHSTCLAQFSNPEPGDLFNDESIGRIDIIIEQEYLDIILEEGNEYSKEEHPATVIIKTEAGADTLSNIGFRLRGNTSRVSQKKSFKVAINAFEKGRDYKGLEKFNINGEHNDPTIIRSKLGWDMMSEIGALASRSNHIEFYINEEYKGLYIHVEHIDEEYIEERFGNKDGNLYKCLYPADLDYLGSNPDAYKLEEHGRRIYELKTNESLDDYSGLANFIDVLNNAPDNTFASEIQTVFHVESYLKALAIEVLTGHWDNYSVNKNNYYLYENPDDGLVYYIPYDLDNTLGVDWFDVDWAETDIYQWYNQNDSRPLAKRIINNQLFRTQFTNIILEVLNTSFDPEVLFPRIDELKSSIELSAENDLYRTLDWGFTIQDFHESFDNRLNQFHVRYGLKEFIERRNETAWDQLVITNIENLNNSFSIYPNPSSNYFNIDLSTYGDLQKLISIHDQSGRLVTRFSTHDKIYQWPNSFSEPVISSGLYFISIKTENEIGERRKVWLK